MCLYLSLSALHVSDSLVHHQERRFGAVYRNWYKPDVPVYTGLNEMRLFPLYCKWCGYTLIPGLYSESVQYPQFLCHSFGYGNSLAHGQTLCALCNIHQRNHTFKLIFWPTFPTLDVFYMFRTLWVQHQEDRCRGSFCMVCLRTKQPFTILSS